MARKLGMAAKLYLNTGTYEAPTWVEVTNCKDLTLNLEKGEADVTTRGNGGWRATTGTLKDASVEFDMIYDTEDTNVATLEDAFFDGTSVGVAVMDGPIDQATSKGVRAEMEVFNFSRSEALEEAITVSVTLKPTYSVNAPEQFTGTAA